jgi:23S rRNA (uridine2552-2'-O)-methyltransferase
MHEHVTDPYVQRARVEGYRSRAAYKLLEIDSRDKLMRPGMMVVDLGAAPGGWSQVAAAKIGPAGRVIAVDLLEMPPIPGVVFLQGDFEDEETLARIQSQLGGHPVDVVICDLAPNLSGIGPSDQADAIQLAERALELCKRLLKPEGCFLVKIFHGAGFEDFVAGLRRTFARVMTRKPRASRARSSEVYLVGKGVQR